MAELSTTRPLDVIVLLAGKELFVRLQLLHQVSIVISSTVAVVAWEDGRLGISSSSLFTENVKDNKRPSFYRTTAVTLCSS